MAAPSLISTRRSRPRPVCASRCCSPAPGKRSPIRTSSRPPSSSGGCKTQLSIEEALDRFFREVGVPAPMSDTVRARALIALAPMIEEEAEEPEVPTEAGWNPLRPDQLIGALQRRARYVEETNLECRLAASIAEEAVAATHVRMALEIAELLADECTPDESIMHYVRSFSLPAIDAQLILRRAMACWAERDPLGLDRVEPVVPPSLAICASGAQLDFNGRLRLGLRAIG